MNWGLSGNDAGYIVKEADAYDITFKFSPTHLVNEPYYDHHVTGIVAEHQSVKGDVNATEVSVGDIVTITNIMSGISDENVEEYVI